MHYLLNASVSGLQHYTVAFPSSFWDGLQTIDKILLDLDPGLHRFLSTTVELIVPGLVIPGVGTPAHCFRNGCSNWGYTRSDPPYWMVSRRVHQLSLVTGREAWMFCSCWVALSHTVAILWPVAVLTLHSLVLEPGLNLLIVKVQNVGMFLHL